MTKKFDWDKSSKRPQPLTLQDEHALIIRREARPRPQLNVVAKRNSNTNQPITKNLCRVAPARKLNCEPRNRKVKQSDFCARTRIGLVGLTLKADDYKPEFTLIKKEDIIIEKT